MGNPLVIPRSSVRSCTQEWEGTLGTKGITVVTCWSDQKCFWDVTCQFVDLNGEWGKKIAVLTHTTRMHIYPFNFILKGLCHVENNMDFFISVSILTPGAKI